MAARRRKVAAQPGRETLERRNTNGLQPVHRPSRISERRHRPPKARKPATCRAEQTNAIADHPPRRRLSAGAKKAFLAPTAGNRSSSRAPLHSLLIPPRHDSQGGREEIHPRGGGGRGTHTYQIAKRYGGLHRGADLKGATILSGRPEKSCSSPNPADPARRTEYAEYCRCTNQRMQEEDEIDGPSQRREAGVLGGASAPRHRMQPTSSSPFVVDLCMGSLLLILLLL